MHKQEIELTSYMPRAIRADKWSAEGNDFDPMLHVTSSGMLGDPDGWRVTVDMLKLHGEHAVAYWYAPIMGPNSFSLEVRFDTEENGTAALWLWNQQMAAAEKQQRQNKRKGRIAR